MFAYLRSASIVCVAVLSFSGAATAVVPPPPPPSPWDLVFGDARTSDYNFRGITQSNRTIHPFLGVEGGMNWSRTDFLVTPPFGVSGSGFTGGLNGGLLFDMPSLPIAAGIRFGWQSQANGGSISAPLASPFFDYKVIQSSTVYIEGMVKLYPGAFKIADNNAPLPRDRVAFSYHYFTASAGVANVRTQVTGMSGAFSVTDTLSRTGPTFTIGIGAPIFVLDNGLIGDVNLQYRATHLPSGFVNIPGSVQLDSFWTQGITFGLDLRY